MSRSEKISFIGATGETLAARLDLPETAPKAYALFAHCFTCTKDIFAASRIAKGLTEHGNAVLRFDFTGLGASEGEFANTNFSSNVGDLVAAATHLRDSLSAPAVLIGHSLGGAAVLVAASEIPEARAVCTIGAPADPAHVAHNFQDSIEEIEANGEANVLLAGRPFRVQKQFLDDIVSQKQEERISNLKKALLVFHSPVDQTVGIENAGEIFQAAKHPKSFVSLDGADHLLSQHVDAAYVADVIASWATCYMDASNSDETAASINGEAGMVIVQETGAGKFANAISVNGQHTLLADEPVTYGGNDTGPSPYDLLLAGLGACKSMTMRMYAERKGISLDKAKVSLHHAKIHAEDCEECETQSGKIDEITVNIELEGDLDGETRQRLFEIADRCPVHRTLHGEIHIVSNLKDG